MRRKSILAKLGLFVLISLAGAACSSSSSAPDAAVALPPGVAAPGTTTAAPPGTVGAPGAPGTATAPTKGSGSAKALQVRFDKIVVKGGGDKAIIKRGVRAHMGEVRACYRQGLAKNANLHGQVEVAIAIKKNGRPAGARVASTTLADRGTAQCVARAARRWAFRGATKRMNAVIRFKFFRG